MRAYVTSIGEPTTELSVWSLERNGFEVTLIQNGSLLADKLKTVYELADDSFVRVDADVIVNKEFTPEFLQQFDDNEEWWLQFISFDWLKLNKSFGGVQYIKKEAIPFLRQRIDSAHHEDRPETSMSRIPEFYEPRRFGSVPEIIVGLHGYALGEQLERVRYQKKKRRKYFDEFDFEMVNKLEGLLREA